VVRNRIPEQDTQACHRPHPMISEIRYVFRSLLRRKGFSFVTLLTLGLGIGSATAIYSVVDWVLFRGAPSPPGLYVIGSLPKGGDFMPLIMVPHYEAYRKLEGVFSDFAVSAYRQGNVVVERDPVSTGFIDVTPNFFKMLGVAPAIGRDFVKGEDVDGRDQVVVVGYGFWKDKLGSSPDALGRKITVDQQQCTVIGVLGKGQQMPVYSQSDVYRPLVIHFNPAKPWDPNLFAIAQARPGATKAQIEDALSHSNPDIPSQMAWMRDMKPAVSTIAGTQNIFRPKFYWTLVGAVGFLYGIACLNATNLMLVHMLGKQREISVRMALGGGRWRIIRLLVLEALGLSLCGSALGALIANLLIPLFNNASSGGGGGFEWGSWHLYWRTYVVLGGLTVVTGFIISLVPAIHVMRADIQAGLKNGGGAIGESPRLARLRGSFVVLQATFAVILLVGAGLMVQTFSRLEHVNVGFDASHRVKIRLGFPSGFPEKNEERLALLRRLQQDLGRVPGVSTVAFSSEALMAMYDAMTQDVLAKDGVTTMQVHPVYMSSDYQKASGMVLKGGRWLNEGPKTIEVLVNETLARKRFGSTDPVGQFLKPTGNSSEFKGWLVVGVVGDIRERVRDKANDKVYLPISWAPSMASNFIVDFDGEPNAATLNSLRKAVFDFDPRIVTEEVNPLTEIRRQQLSSEHLAMSVLKVLAGIAIFLTVVGMFSVLAYTVDRRMAEFGIRMALGASPANLVALVMKRGLLLTLLGIVVGIGGAMALARFLQSLLFETPPYDPVVIGAVACLLALSATGACILPAVRASKPDLIRLLKSD
jgi:predicted permease